MNKEEETNKQDEKSPADKLADKPQTGSLTPGTEKTDSEVQNEKGMNTEKYGRVNKFV